jgi:uncharacterized protein YigE (DUF2233 family)
MMGRYSRQQAGYVRLAILCAFWLLVAQVPVLAYDVPPASPRLRILSMDRRDIEPGLELIQVSGELANGPVRVSVIEVKPGYGWTLAPLLAAVSGSGLATVRDMSVKNNAVAAINGGFFSQTGMPLGLYISDGVLSSQSVYDRGAIAVGYDGRYTISRMKSVLSVRNSDGEIMQLDGANKPVSDAGSEFVLYTGADWATGSPEPPKNGDYLRIVLRDGTVRAVETNGALPNAGPGDFVLLATGAAADRIQGWNISEGSALTLGYAVSIIGGNGSSGAGSLLLPKHAVGGGPLLLADGKPVDYYSEKFQNDVVFSRAPRSAVGIRLSGDLLLSVADGRNPAVSIGLTLTELTDLFIELGCDSALNLDGGGSSTMVVNNEIVNIPSDGFERKVSNAIAIFKKGPDNADPETL